MDTAIVQSRKKTRYVPLALLLTLSLMINVVGITWRLPYYADRAQDSAALMTLKGFPKHFSNGWRSKYPPFHHFILAACYTPYLGYLMWSEQLQTPIKRFPYGLADPLSSLTHLILIARVVSALMGVGIVLWVYLAVRECFDHRAALAAGLIVALYYPLVYYAHNANMDVPYLFWAFLAMYHFVRILNYGHLKNYLLFALFGTLAICTKDQASGLLLLAPLPILWLRFREPQLAASRRTRVISVLCDRRLILAVLVAVVTFAIVQNFLFNFSGFLWRMEYVLGPKQQGYAEYAPTLWARLQLLGETTSHLIFGLTPPLFGMCIVGVIYCTLRYPRYALPVLLLAVSYYVLFINMILWTANRHALPLGIILAFFGGKLLDDLWQWRPWNTLMRAAICLVFAYAALFPIQLDHLFLRGSRYMAEQWMQEHFRDGTVVETFAENHLHLQWGYPRFPSWVKVRYSRVTASTAWEPVPALPDKIRLPNLDFGNRRDAPDYIMISGNQSDGVGLENGVGTTTRDQLIRHLFDGRLDYALVATLKTPTVVPIRSLIVNPYVYIFERRAERAT